MNVVDMLRKFKHAGFVALKHAKWVLRDGSLPLLRAYSKRHGFTYEKEKYEARIGPGGNQGIPTSSTFPVDHLFFPPTLPYADGEAVPRRIYLLWTGENAMTSNREQSVERIRRQNPYTDVVVVTPENIEEFVVDGHPLHPTYSDLSFVHRADYLRAYLMYHHGGAYLDIKPYSGSIDSFFELLEADPNLWAVGTGESPVSIAWARGGALGRDQKVHVSKVLCQATFAFRPHSLLAAVWLSEVERRLSYFADLLQLHPATDAFGADGQYPVPWFSLLGAVLPPLCLKYHRHIAICEEPKMQIDGFDTYR